MRRQLYARLLVLVVLLGSSALTGGCSNRSVEGTVERATDHQPVAGAIVRVSDATTRTAQDGTFLLEDVSPGATEGAVEVTGFPATKFAIAGGENGVVTVKIADASLRVSVEELATQPRAVTTCTVTIDGKPIAVDSATPGLLPGRHRIALTGNPYMPWSKDVTLTAGENTLTVNPSLTATETYARMLYETQYGRHNNAYLYIHPAERKILSLKNWNKDLKVLQMIEYQLGEARLLPTWTSKLMKTTYSDVMEIDRTYKEQVISTKYSDFGKVYTSSQNQHWVLVDGVWYMVHAEKFW